MEIIIDGIKLPKLKKDEIKYEVTVIKVVNGKRAEALLGTINDLNDINKFVEKMKPVEIKID